MKRVLFISLIATSLVACEVESRLASIDVVSSIDMYVGDKIVLEVSHSPVDALVPEYRFNTSNRYVATVNDLGAVVSNHVGNCTIMIATGDTRFSTYCVINVKPKSELFCEPALDFGVTKATVKVKEQNSVIADEIPAMLVYQGFEAPVMQIAYQFDENQKLAASVVKLSANVSSELKDFMNERYDLVPSAAASEYISVWRGNDMEIVTRIMDNACYAVYQPYSGKSTVEHAISAIETVRNSSK